MRKLKDSGITWVGEIPKDWETVKLKYVAPKVERGTAPDYTEDENMVKVVNQATFSKGMFDTSKQRYSSKPAELSRGLLKRGDTLVASTGGGVLGKTYYFDEDEVYVADGHVTVIRPDETLAVSKFLHYFISVNYDTLNTCMAEGSTNQTELQRDLFCNMYFPSPSVIEQQAIVSFLDSKCAAIDALSADIQSEIDTLEAYKRSKVYAAVSHGVKNTALEETDSNVWASIPHGWKLVDIKYLFEIVKRIAGKEGYDILAVTKQGIKAKDISSNEGQIASDYSGYQFVYPGDFAMNCLDLNAGWIDISRLFGVTSPDYRVFKLRDQNNYCADYYKYLFQMCYTEKIFYSLTQGVTESYRRLPASVFNNFKVPVPPKDEQVQIATFLDEICGEVNTIIVQKREQLTILNDYKKSVIYEYVTGKKEVI